MSVSIILPTYCEAENIESLIRDIEELKIDSMIVVIDDSSSDGTGDIVVNLQGEYGNIHLISRSEKLGLGTAITAGFRYLVKLTEVPDYVVTMDADYSHNPPDITSLVNAAKRGYDLVIGSRYYRGGKVVGSRIIRRFISRIANLFAALAVGTRTHDCTSGFRCYSINYVKEVLGNLHSQTYEIQIETLRQARMNGFKVKEIPITFVNRKKGKSKLTITEIQAFLAYVLKTALNGLGLFSSYIVKSHEENDES